MTPLTPSLLASIARVGVTISSWKVFDVKDGRCTSNGTLAGSILTMDRAVRNLMQFAELDRGAALRAASYNPATTVGIASKRGFLAAGAEADFVVLNPQNEVIKTVVHGTGL